MELLFCELDEYTDAWRSCQVAPRDADPDGDPAHRPPTPPARSCGMTESNPIDLLVIGAGVAGATAAAAAAEAGLRVRVLEKSRGLGGRCATRRREVDREVVRFDHGAQFFTVRDPGFQRRVDAWREAGDVAVWTHGVARWTPGRGIVPADDHGHARYVVPAGMSRLARLLIGDVEVQVRQRATGVAREAAGWRVDVEDGAPQRARAVLLTAPVPQSLALLPPHGAGRASDDGGAPGIDEAAREALESVVYAPSFALMAADAEAPPAWRGLRLDDHPVLSWIAVDGSKRDPAPAGTTWVAHASAAYARERFDAPRDEVADEMTAALRELTGRRAAPGWRSLHRWRYALCETPLDAPHLRLSDGLWAAGDGFGAGRVEGAFLSGRAAADAILAELD